MMRTDVRQQRRRRLRAKHTPSQVIDHSLKLQLVNLTITLEQCITVKLILSPWYKQMTPWWR